jgi:Alpha galactosidase C-terminal beta sandwich domain
MVLCLGLLLISCDHTKKQENIVSNDILSLAYDTATNNMQLKTRLNDKVILKIFPVETYDSFHKEDVTDSVFGEGSSLYVSSEQGGSTVFTLYQSQPFVFINQIVKNNSGEVIDINRLNSLSFSIDMGKKVSDLKTLGTGGLLDPDKNPGSYVFLTTVDPETRNGIVSGWLSSEKGCGVFFSDINDSLVTIDTRVDYGHFLLPSGKSEATETLVIGYFDDARLGAEQFAENLAKYNNIVLPDRTAAYCSWYDDKHGGAGSEASTIELADYISANLLSFGLGVLQIDDLWQGGGKYNGPKRGFDRVDKNGGYPNGMEKAAKAIKDAGLTAGIWWMPFARNHQDPEYADRQHWFAYRTNGKPFETVWGGTSLDLTQPEVMNQISEYAKKIQGWGFDYFKMDALWTGTVTEHIYINDGYKEDSIGNCKLLHDPSITQIEAFRNGLKTIRKATANKVFLSGCNLSQNMRIFGASIGLVDAMRIGPDFNHDGENIRTGVIRASRLYFLNGRVWWNDPDPTVLREGGQSNVDSKTTGIGGLTKARLLPSFVALSGQFFLSSDWLPDLPVERIEIIKRSMASHNGIARPVDAFDRSIPAIWLASDDKSGTQRNVIGLFNWKTNEEEIASSLKWAGLSGKETYHAFDFWENKVLPDISGSFSFNLPSESCKVIALRAKTDHPVVVSTSQHLTQGMIDLISEKWEDGTLSGTSKVIGGDDYELRIAGLDDDTQWIPDKALIIDDEASVTIEMLPRTEKGWLRVLIKAQNDMTLNWQIKFNR